MSFPRRSFLASLPVFLTGCGAITTNTNNGVTTITVNVAEIDAWGQAFINAASLLAPLAGSASATLLAIGTVAKADLAAVDQYANGQVTLTFSRNSIPSVISSLIADGQKLLATAQPVIPAAAESRAQEYLTALATIVSTAEAVIGVVPTQMAARLSAERPLTEGQALSTLGVQ